MAAKKKVLWHSGAKKQTIVWKKDENRKIDKWRCGRGGKKAFILDPPQSHCME